MTTPEADDRGVQPLPAANPFAERAGDPGEPKLPLSLATLSLPWAAALLWLVLCAIVNTAAAPFMEHLTTGPPMGVEFIVLAVGIGIFGGQIGGLSAVLVWGGGPFFWARLVVLWLVAAALYGCWFAGLLAMMMRFDDWSFRWYQWTFARELAASLPLISLALQLPQWLARLYFGWRIEPPGNSAGNASRGLSIRDFMVGTAVTALTLTAVRFSHAGAMTTGNWIAWGMAFGILAVISALVMLPLLVLIFRCHWLWALLYIAVGSPLLASLTMYVIVLIQGRVGGPDARDIVGFLLAATTCVAATSVPLWLARWAGYRLKFGREE